VVAADLRIVDNISALKAASAKLTRVARRIFVIDSKARLSVVQAYALGATHVLATPVCAQQLLAKLSDAEAAAVASTSPVMSGGQEAATAGAASIASMFSAVISGSPIDVKGAKRAGSGIADSIAEHGLSEWLTTVRRHHEGTYQHCLLVTGIAVDFGLSLAMAKADIERLYSAAMFHDIGKVRIPLAVLDKPGRLNARERTLLETHPAAGYEILKDTPGNFRGNSRCRAAPSRISRWQRISRRTQCSEHIGYRPDPDHSRHFCRTDRATGLQDDHAPGGSLWHSL
jgi:HD-GYP domain-containing protein (c-di-GMP phosphodiesterase class II)